MDAIDDHGYLLREMVAVVLMVSLPDLLGR